MGEGTGLNAATQNNTLEFWRNSAECWAVGICWGQCYVCSVLHNVTGEDAYKEHAPFPHTVTVTEASWFIIVTATQRSPWETISCLFSSLPQSMYQTTLLNIVIILFFFLEKHFQLLAWNKLKCIRMCTELQWDCGSTFLCPSFTHNRLGRHGSL